MTNDRFALARTEAERLVRAGGLSYERIAIMVGVHFSTVRRWTMQYGWPRGPERAVAPFRPAWDAVQAQLGPAAEPGSPAKGRKRRRRKIRPADRAELIRRLYAAIDRNLQALELRMTDDATPTAADGERDARALGTAIRNLEKVTELESGTERNTDTARERAAPLSGDEADRLRLELAERILRLRRQRGDT